MSNGIRLAGAAIVMLILLTAASAHAAENGSSGGSPAGPVLPVIGSSPVYLAPTNTVASPFVTVEAEMDRYVAQTAALDISGNRADGTAVQMNDVYCAIIRGESESKDRISCSAFLSEGDYQVTVQAWDQTGAMSSTNGSFSVSVPVRLVTPLESGVSANFTFQAEMERYVASRARLDVTGSRRDGVPVDIHDIYCAISRGAPGHPDLFSCPVFLSDGDYQASLKVWDQNGYLQTTVGSFTVSSEIANMSPAGKLSQSAFDVGANLERSVGQRARAAISGVLYGGGVYDASDIYCSITRGASGESDRIACPVSLSDGDYEITLQVWDANGFLRTARSSISLSMRPVLSVQADRSFWFSYADYQAGWLTTAMTVSNSSEHAAASVRITGGSNSNGVVIASAQPIECGDLVSGANAQVFVKYSVPPGVSSFRSRLQATAVNSNGTVYRYPS